MNAIPFKFLLTPKLMERRFSSGHGFPDGDTSWIDGLRGVVACIVICNHLVLSLRYDIIFPPSAEDRLHGLWHWPFFHAVCEGFPWVAIFFVLSGWVNALKPLKLMDNGESDAAFLSLSTSCFRRSLRVMMPPTITTIASCILAQFGAYALAKSRGNAWMSSTSPDVSDTFGDAVMKLLHSFYTTWTSASNYYDANQWCMLWILKGSMTLYLVLLGLARAKPSMRRLILLGLFAWSWKMHEGYVAIPTYGGLLFTEISSFSSIHKFTASRSLVKHALVGLLFLAGFYLMSMPSVNWEWAPWFNFVLEDCKFLFPDGSDVYILTSYIGVFLTLLSILVSTAFQRILTHPICLWLGQLSLPIYLIHGPVIRTLFCWLIYGFTQPEYREELDANGNIEKIPGDFPPPSSVRLFVSIAVFFGVVLFLARLWYRNVEPWCAKVAKYVEDIITGKRALLLRFIDSRDDAAEY